MKKPVIAVAPIKYFDIHKTHNLVKIRRYIKKAKKAGADIICFPEACISKNEQLPIDHKLILAIQEECRKNSIWCIVTEDIMIRNKPYNMSILINRKGRIKGKYKKINLYGDKVLPGNRVKVFKTDFGKIGIVICWDLTFPYLFDAMKEKGAEIVFCPSMWWYEAKSHESLHKKREIDLLRALLLARAYESIFFVALCNQLMDAKHQVSYSAIASPHRILKELINEEGLIIAEIDLDEIKKFRKFYSKT